MAAKKETDCKGQVMLATKDSALLEARSEESSKNPRLRTQAYPRLRISKARNLSGSAQIAQQISQVPVSAL